MKTFEVRLVEVYHIEAETSEEAYDLASRYHSDDHDMTDEERDCVDYRHGDDTTREI